MKFFNRLAEQIQTQELSQYKKQRPGSYEKQNQVFSFLYTQ